MTPQQLTELREIIYAVLAAIRVGEPTGAPAGVLYAGLQHAGCRLSQFQSLMLSLERLGLVRKEGLLYFLTPAGKTLEQTHASKGSA